MDSQASYLQDLSVIWWGSGVGSDPEDRGVAGIPGREICVSRPIEASPPPGKFRGPQARLGPSLAPKALCCSIGPSGFIVTTWPRLVSTISLGPGLVHSVLQLLAQNWYPVGVQDVFC